MRTVGLGRYRVVAALGRGGMGEVYEARDLALGRPVAIKVLVAEEQRSPARLARFEREGRLLAALSHPHIVSVHEVASSREGVNAYMVMELLRGESLHEIICAKGALPLSRACGLALQVLAGLEAAHREGIVHRDVKPSNVVVIGDDEEERAKLIDFGVASSPAALGFVRLTHRGQVLGTPSYMAPEQAAGLEVDARADIYGAAGLLWTMLAGHPPFFGRPRAEVMDRLVRGDRDLLAVHRPDIPRIARVVDRAMSYAPRRRFATAAAMRDALADALGRTGEPEACGRTKSTRCDRSARTTVPMEGRRCVRGS